MSPNRPVESGWHLALLALWILAAAALFALLEIQIEGAQGWAAGLPTWRIDSLPWLKALFGGRSVTGYHLFAFSFMALMFHLPIAVLAQWSWRLEALMLGGLMLFWVAEDALWFILNPAFGWARLTPEHAAWHPHWILGLPADYPFFLGITGLLWGLAVRRPSRPPSEPP